MEKMQDLKDLLTHEVEDLLSAEKQIIDALPAMIEKAKNQQLKNALQQHLQVTQKQKQRIEEIVGMLKKGEKEEDKNGLLSRLFSGGEKVCKGMQGLIKEGEKIIGADMNPQVLDAAIIACAQKIEHYEICGYGTVKAYADELNLPEVSRMLELTLNEEYEADDLLTSLALGGLNQKAENGGTRGNNKQNRTTSRTRSISSNKTSAVKKKQSSENGISTSKNERSASIRKARTSGNKKRATKKAK
jgi:ferritin-like metal-binding protein YciE